MPLESATYISDLVPSNPAASDGMNNADDHMRLIKAALKNTLPNFNAAALAATQAQIDAAVAAVVGRPNATVPAGAICDFAMPSAPAGWLPCDGWEISRTDYAALFAAIGTTWGAGNGSTTFNIPNLLVRFRRHRDNGATSGVVGTLQGPCNLSHYHNVAASGMTGAADRGLDHLHTGGGTTGNDSPDHSHGYDRGAYPSSSTGGGAFAIIGTNTAANTGGASTRHQHPFSFTTNGADRSLDHLHGWSFNVNSGGGSADGAEARPYSASVLTCIKI